MIRRIATILATFRQLEHCELDQQQPISSDELPIVGKSLRNFISH